MKISTQKCKTIQSYIHLPHHLIHLIFIFTLYSTIDDLQRIFRSVNTKHVLHVNCNTNCSLNISVRFHLLFLAAKYFFSGIFQISHYLCRRCFKLTRGKIDYQVKIYLPEIFRWIGQPVVGLLPLNWKF